MSVKVKICGLSTADALAAAIGGGADFVGFVFYGPSPRNLTLEAAGALAASVPATVKKVALVVDAADELLDSIVAEIRPDYIQAHGQESPQRIAAIRTRFGIPVIKAVKLHERADLATADAYENVADMILFDARPPQGSADVLPGGNGIAFDWTLLAGRHSGTRYMLSGGLDPDNVANAVRISGATVVDVSSGVESHPGVKDLGKIRRFLDIAKAL